jgi:hypothetical protein
MKSKKALSAASYPSRILKNDVTIKCPDCMVLCSGGCLTVATNSKNKETTTQSWSEDFSSGHFFMF